MDGDNEFDGLIGSSESMRTVRNRISHLAGWEETVLIVGESGTGKELVARSLHRRSRRKAGPFIDVNCAAVPETLFETEFFGHERGAFTDAHHAHGGCFEQANGGTLLLDEVGDLSIDAQAKLLRVTEQRTIRRLGGEKPIRVDIRLIASTNVDLGSAVREHRFRADLYHRLSATVIRLPPLRAHPGDIPEIATAFLRRYCFEHSAELREISSASLARMRDYEWPGNVRELQNAIRQAAIDSEGPEIEILPGETSEPQHLGMEVRAAQGEIERRRIVDALADCHSLAATAAALGMDVKTLYRKRLKYGLAEKHSVDG